MSSADKNDSPMARFYLPPAHWSTSLWELPEDEARHASKVLRMREGDQCIVFDGHGIAAHANILSISSATHVTLQPGEFCTPPLHTPTNITLCQSIPKGGNMDLIIQKSVELGVSHIIPLITERTIVRLTDKEASAKQEKWQRVALEACKQCGQNTLPLVAHPIHFTAWLNQGIPSELPLIASLAPGARPIRHILEEARQAGKKQVALLVGPEGDFTTDETQRALQSGFIPITLGDIILRVETASFFSLSAIRYALDE